MIVLVETSSEGSMQKSAQPVEALRVSLDSNHCDWPWQPMGDYHPYTYTRGQTSGVLQAL